jgi:hypothetical protein
MRYNTRLVLSFLRGENVTTAFTLYVIYIFMVLTAVGVISFFLGKWESLLTYILLTICQGIIAIKLASIAITQFGDRVSFTPQINLGMIVAIFLLIFAKSEKKAGAICYFAAMTVIAFPLLFFI